MSSVVCFGEALIDFLSEPVSDSHTQRRFVQHAGGAPANVAVAVARLGVPASFSGMLGLDMFGDFLLERLEDAGVSTEYVVRTTEANTALAFVSLDENGERRFSFYRPPAADLLFKPQHFSDTCFVSASIFHACSNSLTEAGIADATFEGMRRAHAAGALVSFDMNLRMNLWPTHADPRPRIWSALHEAELVKLSTEELSFLAEVLGSEAAVLAELWRGRTQWLWITNGPAPIRYVTRAGQGMLPAFEVATVNTTGAGDAFVGGMLSWLVRERVTSANLESLLTDQSRMESGLGFAAACGALAVTRHGAFEAMPTFTEVEDFMRKRT